MLTKFDPSTPVRILITSRGTVELERRFKILGGQRVLSGWISTVETLSNIELLVEAKSKSVLVGNDEDRASLVKRMLKKSEGFFLWTVLVLDELMTSYSEKEMNEALEEMPRDMESLYKRTLHSMSQTTGGEKLAKSILTWTTCATRPLTVNELEGALRLDIKDTFPRLDEGVSSLCGNLVNIDKYGRVQMLHETAREFLLND